MNHLSIKISLKQLYGLAYQWAAEKEKEQEPEAQLAIAASVAAITDYLDYVWKNKSNKVSKTALTSKETKG